MSHINTKQAVLLCNCVCKEWPGFERINLRVAERESSHWEENKLRNAVVAEQPVADTEVDVNRHLDAIYQTLQTDSSETADSDT